MSTPQPQPRLSSSGRCFAGTALVHDSLGSVWNLSYYAEWYGGPQPTTQPCVSAYIGIVPKYKNFEDSSCETRKQCTGCEIKNSFQDSTVLTLRGLCKYSHFDTQYKVEYSPDTIISYVGRERSIISYDFDDEVWVIRDVTNPEVTAVSRVSFRSLALGSHH